RLGEGPLRARWADRPPLGVVKRSRVSCPGEPNPPDEKLSLSGWVFSSATSPASDLAGTEGLTTSTWLAVASLITGAKSVSSRKLTLGSRAGAAEYPRAMA